MRMESIVLFRYLGAYLPAVHDGKLITDLPGASIHLTKTGLATCAC